MEEILTERLLINVLTEADASFIIELVNTPEWLLFIGERNVKTNDDALKYIDKILGSLALQYWMVRLRENTTAIGIITLIQRDYLADKDIGFAFLPQYTKKGYAIEATKALLKKVQCELPVIKAVTISHNINSISLLEKLGFVFEKTLEIDSEKLELYSIST